MKRFSGICIITEDVRRLRDFYREVLQVEPQGDDVFTAFQTEGAELAIFTRQGMQQMAPGSMQGIGQGSCTLEFEVEDVDREYARLSSLNVPIVKPLTTQPWGRRSVWFRDPDGNIVNFYATLAGSQPPEDLKALVRRYFQRLLNEKDVAVVDEMLSKDYQDTDYPPGTPPGPENTREYVDRFMQDYPDMRFEIEELLAEGNQVAARLLWRGNHRETGVAFHQMGIIMLRINGEGRIAERWSAYKVIE